MKIWQKGELYALVGIQMIEIKINSFENGLEYTYNLYTWIYTQFYSIYFFYQSCCNIKWFYRSYLYLYSLRRRIVIIYCGCLTGEHTRHPNSHQIPSELFADTRRASHASRRGSFTRYEELSDTQSTRSRTRIRGCLSKRLWK